MKRFFYLLNLSCMLMLSACGVDVPSQVIVIDSVQANIYPDYRNVEIPCNIAPLNFIVRNSCKEAVVEVVASDGKKLLAQADEEGRVIFPQEEWKDFLRDHTSSTLSVFLYVRNEHWGRYDPFTWYVSPDSIDPLLTCRLIEPSYRVYGSLTLTSFDLEHNRHRNIVENDELRGDKNGVNQCCMNCHSQQKNGSGNSLFHYRGKHGGMVLTYNGKSRVVNTKVGDLFASTTYVAWHPTLPLIAFSINDVGQCFPSSGKAKVEIMDSRSDLVLYDIEKDEIRAITKSYDKMETFPCWSGDGKRLYYATSDSLLSHISQYKRMKYDIASLSFDVDSMRFGEPHVVTNLSSLGKSASQPKASPDGKFVVFSVSEFGCSPYRHEDCDLYQLNTVTGEVRPLSEINSSSSDSYHDWSSNGKWMIFSSRKEDDNYARPFFTHCDSTGHFSKPFQIPHADPTFDLYLLKSYNVPEFAQVEPAMTPAEFYSLLEQDPSSAKYVGEIDSSRVDGMSGASVIR